jgi:hypothetical protein
VIKLFDNNRKQLSNNRLGERNDAGGRSTTALQAVGKTAEKWTITTYFVLDIVADFDIFI